MTHAPVAKKKRSQEDDGEESVDAVPIPPDGGWGWMVAFASFAIHIVSKYRGLKVEACKVISGDQNWSFKC